MTKKEDIIIMNFSGIYRQQQFWRTGEIQRQNISWVEVQELTGSNCYCDEEAAKVLKEKLKKISGKEIILIQKTDPALLAGGRVELDGKLLDGTVKNRISEISDKIHHATG